MGRQGSPFASELPGIEQRNAEIVHRHKGGEDLASIGASLGLTRARVRQIVRSGRCFAKRTARPPATSPAAAAATSAEEQARRDGRRRPRGSASVSTEGIPRCPPIQDALRPTKKR